MIKEYCDAVKKGFPKSILCICIDPTKMASRVMSYLIKDSVVFPVGADGLSLQFADVVHDVKMDTTP